jgi:exonuclease V
MAAPSVSVTHASSYYGSEVEIDAESPASVSDYGSEFDATELNEDTLLATALDSLTESLPGVVKKASVLPSVEFEEGEAEDEDEDEKDVVIHKPSRLRMSKRPWRGAEPLRARRDLQSSPVQETLEVEYDERSRRAWSGASNPLRQL